MPKAAGEQRYGSALSAAEKLAADTSLTDDEKRTFLATLSGVCLVSDGFIPFRDNIDHNIVGRSIGLCLVFSFRH